MTRAAAIGLALATLFAAAGRADEPHFEFVRALRANGMADLAVDYLDALTKNPPANLKAILPLELAKARLDLAVLEGDDKKRNKQFDAARKAYDDFLKANPTHPLAAEARLDLARLTTFQGKQLLAQARRSDDKAARLDLVARARPLFADAAARLGEAGKAIDAKLQQLAAPANDAEKTARESLTRAKGQARLETAINKLNQAMSMADATSKDIKDRAAVIRSAQDDLVAIYNADKDGTYGWLARVWAGKCFDELDDKPAALKLYEAVAKEEKPAAVEAARLAQYWLLLIKFKDKETPKRAEAVKAVIDGCELWLKENPGAANSAEGQGLRFLLASALEETAQPGIVRNDKGIPTKVTPGSRPTFQRAERILKALADGENEWTERARNKRAGILVVLMAERAAGPVQNLNNFEECYLTAQVEAWDATQGKKSEAEKAKKYTKAIAALNRGLTLIGRNDSTRDVADARVMLTYAYLLNNDTYAAAIIGESVGRSPTIGPRGVEATAYALQAYSAIMAEDRQRGLSDDYLKTDQRHLRNLAAFMEKTWPEEPVTDFARHQLAMFLEQEGNVVDALAMLSRISPNYPGLASARFLQGTSVQKLQGKDVKLPDEQKKKLLAETVAILEKLPEPVPGASEETTIAACMARLQLGNLYLLGDGDAKAFEKAETLGKKMSELTPKLALAKALVPQVALESSKVQLAGALGKVGLLFKGEKPEDGVTALAPLLERVKKEVTGKPPETAGEPWYGPYREVQIQVLLLALRSAIEENKPVEAQAMLALVEQTSKAAGNLGTSANDRLLHVVFDLKKAAEAFKAKNETEKREKLEKGLASFLDEMARPKDLPANVRAFLAQAYSSLERHDKAAEVLAAIAPPTKADDEDGKRFYQYARMTQAKEHRLAKQYKEAAAVLSDILKDWGKNNLDVRAEKILLLEDGGNLRGASDETKQIQQALKKQRDTFDDALRAEKAADEELRKAKTDPEREAAQAKLAAAQQAKSAAQPMRDRYWQFYFYELRIVLKSGNLQKDAAAKEKRIASVAGEIRKLEDGQDDFGGGDLKQKFAEMIAGDPVLKTKYSEAGGKKLLAP